jgi:hypothetical protein
VGPIFRPLFYPFFLLPFYEKILPSKINPIRDAMPPPAPLQSACLVGGSRGPLFWLQRRDSFCKRVKGKKGRRVGETFRLSRLPKKLPLNNGVTAATKFDQLRALVISSEARQSRVGYAARDCFGAMFLLGDDST